jgi:hypothetical protein
LATCPAKRELLARLRNQKKHLLINCFPFFILHSCLQQAGFIFHFSPLGSFSLALFPWLLAFGSWLLAFGF